MSLKLYTISLVCIAAVINHVYCDTPVFTIEPSMLLVQEGRTQVFTISFTNCSLLSIDEQNVNLNVVIGTQDRSGLVELKNNTNLTVTCNESASTAEFVLQANELGFVELAFKNTTDGNTLQRLAGGVLRPSGSPLDTVFLVGIIFIQIVNTVLFGVGLDLEKVKQFLKKPVAPAIGVVGQFLIMPLIGISLTYMINKNEAIEFGVFASSVAPGGGASNVWSYLLGGDMDLSITMTFISSLLALPFMPAWIYSMGPVIAGQSDIVIPFDQMALTLAYILGPIVVGLLINKYLLKLAKFLKKATRYFVVLSVIFIIVVATWANIYAFKVLFADFQLALCCAALPYSGGLIAYGIGRLFRQGHRLSTTIGLETAIQSTNITVILLRSSLADRQPYADLSTAFPICLNLFMPLLCDVLLVIRIIYIKCIRKPDEDSSDSDGTSLKETEKNVENSAYNSDPPTDLDSKISYTPKGVSTSL